MDGSEWQRVATRIGLAQLDGSEWQQMATNGNEWQLALGLLSWTAATGSEIVRINVYSTKLPEAVMHYALL